MSEDKNKLSFKGTPGPWKFVHARHYTIPSGDGQRYAVKAGEHWLINIKLDRTVDIPVHQEAEANAHMVSAAPEAVEFIADLLNELQTQGFLSDIDKWLDRGELITKKAYNF